MTTALVIPTCNEARLVSFLAAWEVDRFWDVLIVVEDGPVRSFAVDTHHHYSWNEIEAELQKASWVISHRDSAIRSFGFWKAYRLGCEYVVTLDDDCYPHPGQDFLSEHLQALDATPLWAESVLGLRTRGLPYGDRGVLREVMLNVGLWTGVPDFDAPSQLVLGTMTDFTPPDESRVLPRRQYVPICGMNLCFRREFAPLAYFPLQGEGWPFRRFDDIWFGVIAKKVCDHLGWYITMGRPWVRHVRASDVYQNLVKEAPGIGFNERLWRMVDAVDLEDCRSPKECMRQVGLSLAGQEEGYLHSLGTAIQVWVGLFRED